MAGSIFATSSVRDQLGKLAKNPKLVGVRHIVQGEPDDRFLLQPEFLRGIQSLEEFNLTYDILIYPQHLPVAVEFVQKFPRQRFVLDHLAKPLIKAHTVQPWASHIGELAKFPNVFCKLSGMVTEADWKEWKTENFAAYLDVALESFGPERLMIGSDWPVCKAAASYSQVMAIVADHLERYPRQTRESIFGGTAQRFWRIGHLTMFEARLLYNSHCDMQKILQLDSRDNVLIALTDLRKGGTISRGDMRITLVTDVPAKQKFPIEDLAVGAPVTMYGVLVGKASQYVRCGELLTTGNIHHEAAPYHETRSDYRWNPPNASRWEERKFMGYARCDGQVGTRNYWVVVPLVFCENRNILNLKQAFEEELGFARPQLYRQQVAQLARLYREGKQSSAPQPFSTQQALNPSERLFPNVDGIKFLLHEGGCGGTREDADNLCGLIAGYLHHPNVAGATVLSLGCQNAQIEILRKQLASRNPHFNKPLVVLEQQKSGSEFAMLSEAIEKTFAGLAEANKAQRTAADISRLCVGLKCGGSDGFSGLSANPAIGHTSDLLVALGARTLLSEFPELCGVEQNLIFSTAPASP